ncbi:MAG: hypothetical protein EXS29_04310 [Pedosphaera sp.]|nr:hypothetical protein [Pedosphaera sp.]
MKAIKPTYSSPGPFEVFTLLWLSSIILFAFFTLKGEARNVITVRQSNTSTSSNTNQIRGGGGGWMEFANVFNAGTNSGTIEIVFKPLLLPDKLDVYYPPRKNNGRNIYSTTNAVNLLTVKNPLIATFNGSSTMFEIVVNEGSEAYPDTKWSYDGVVKNTNGNVILQINMNQTESIVQQGGRVATPRNLPTGLNRFSTRNGSDGPAFDEDTSFANRISLRIPTPEKTTTSR